MIAGQFIVLDSGDERLRSVYEGIWNIYSCIHRFENGQYNTDLVCYSTYTYNVNLNK